MKLLIGASPSKFFHMKEFTQELEKNKITSNLVLDENFVSGFPNRKISNWVSSKRKFNDLINDFKPDLILVDRQKHFAKAAVESNIPVLVHLRGDFWSEIKWAKETIYKGFPKNMIIKKWEEIGKYCFDKADIVLPICKFLEKKVNEEIPKRKTAVMYQGINPNNWFKTEGMKLKHPCVGILQGATIWGKTKEMLLLSKILKAHPEITFYWVGDGPYREKITSVLNKFDNFEWLGSLEYPDKVREFLDEIDVYALISGIDMSPLTLQEAQLMSKPVLATNVGGIPELMKNNETGYLITKGDHLDWIEKISFLINDQKKMHVMGITGRKFIEENFSWNTITTKFISDLKKNDLIKLN